MELLITGGIWFTLPILVMGLISLGLIALLIIRKVNSKPVNPFMRDSILFLGFLSLAWGILGQVLGMFQAAGAIVEAGEIAPSLIWAGFKVSLIAPVMGLMVLILSGVGWFGLRGNPLRS
jgi:hypothetical protein